MNVIDKRTKMFSGLLMGLFICFAVFLAAINLTVDKPGCIARADVYEGEIYTSDGVCLTELKNLDSSSPEKKHARSLKYPEAYSHLLGFNSTRYGTSGLRDRYSDWLYDGKRNKNGKDLQLTINHNLQLFCYDELNAFGKNGSIVVIDNEGAIRALVSTKESGTYNANEVDSLDFSKIPDGFLVGEYEQSYLPGSTLKLLSSIALIENGQGDFVYNDKTGYINIGGGTIHNAGNSIKGELDLKNALKESANVYFVSALDGTEGFYNQLKDVASRFKLGEEIRLDFCSMNSSFDYTPENDFQKALAVFGQGNESAVTSIQNAMIFSCIMNNNGTMMKPYVVETNTERGFFEELFNMNCEVKPEVLAKNVISKKTAKKIKEALEYTAVEGYGLPEGIAKSGTAELPNGKNQLWLCVATEDYSICISITSRGYSSSLIKPMKNILGFIENNEF